MDEHLPEADRQRELGDKRFAALTLATGQIVWTMPPTGVVDDMPLWRAFTGQRSDAVAGWGWLDALHPDDRAAARRCWQPPTPQPDCCELAARVRHADGSYRLMRLRAAPIFDAQGTLQEWVVAATDITAPPPIAHNSDALTTAQAQVADLTELNHRMDEFLGIVSHELRTPLTAMKASIQLAARRIQTLLKTDAVLPEAHSQKLAQTYEMLDRSDRQANRLTSMIGELLDTSRIQLGRFEVQLAPCDINAVVGAAIAEQQEAWPERVITLLPDDDADHAIAADSKRIEQVITNMLVNAIRYSPATTPIVVTVRREPAQVHVSVRDQGPGIASSEHTKIWERFYRVPDTQDMNGTGIGFGVGLFICQQIVAQHGGAVGVVSAPGEGATFWFSLPILAA